MAHCLSEQTVELLAERGFSTAGIHNVVDVIERALDEDLAYGEDVTTVATISESAVGRAQVVAREAGTLAGVPVAAAVAEIVGEQYGTPLDVTVVRHDGEHVAAGDVVLEVAGSLRTMLTAERTLLNLLCQLSGVATHTARWARALEGTGTTVRDTRKTTPGLRSLEKYAVRCGGGMNHRMGLGDAALIKDNHVAAAGSVSAAFAAVREYNPSIVVEVECDTLEQVEEAVAAGAELILLDNMSAEQVARALTITQPAGVKTEASGGITLDNAAAYAATGVDYIAVGALTHSSPVLDLGLDLIEDASSIA